MENALLLTKIYSWNKVKTREMSPNYKALRLLVITLHLDYSPIYKPIDMIVINLVFLRHIVESSYQNNDRRHR